VREYIRASDIANEISMKRSFFDGSFLIVEGVTDSKLYGKFTDRLTCQIIPAHSKDNVKIAVRDLALRRNYHRILGILDSDLEKLTGIPCRPPVFVTDCRDSDTVMIRSTAFDHVLTEYGDPDKMYTFVNKYGGIRDAVVESCYALGILMYVSDVNDHCLSFKDLDHAAFVDRRGLHTDVNKMVDTVISNSAGPKIDRKTLMAQLNKEMNNERDPWDVCRGHDMISVLSIGLRDVFGSYNCRTIRTGELAGALRLAYDRETFRMTKLFRDTEGWCSANKIKIWN
jgi:hypothetical protein